MAILIKHGDSNIDRRELGRASKYFRWHVRIANRADNSSTLLSESFEMAQWALQTDAADAVVQMSARFASGHGGLAVVIREFQDLVRQRQMAYVRLSAAAGKADRVAAETLRREVATINARLDALDYGLRKEFPDYERLARPKPLDRTAAQALLNENEALVLYLNVPSIGKLPEEAFAWVVTKNDARWLKLVLTPTQIDEAVAALRCGLDQTLWYGGETADKCTAALKAMPADESVDGRVVQVLPFDVARAHALYEALLGPIEAMTKGKQLLIVPSGSLTSLPFHVLVTATPNSAIPRRLIDYRDVAWLGLDQPITVLPSVASLKALRQFARASRATKPYLGVGNPLLDGPDWTYAKQAEAARARQSCSTRVAQRLAPVATYSFASFAKLFRGAQTDIERIRAWAPLPETADELCEVGRRFGVRDSDILLGPRASETILKRLSDGGQLAQYSVVHFATHGALVGQVQGAAEPGLILTPPDKGTRKAEALELDDGFLTASEIATLKLDAEWVVLSACNTAGGAGENAEALSGMARAFFYAGARALLVSHWEVGSDAAVKLTTHAFGELKSKPKIGRAEALRRSMRELMLKGNPAEAHPALWAPFVVVGEGAR